MSKSTKKYGKVAYTLRSSIDANPIPSDRAVEQFTKLDKLARKVYNKPYAALSTKDKVELHFGLNTGKFKE